MIEEEKRIKAEKWKKYYEENRDIILEKARGRYKENREEYLLKEKTKRKENVEEFRKKDKEYREKNREQINRKARRYAEKRVNENPDEWSFIKRRNKIKTLYNVSVDFIVDLMNKQKGCCAICGCSLVNPNSKQTYSIDHCHSTGKVRGLLCIKCNAVLEYSVKHINTIKKYLEENNT